MVNVSKPEYADEDCFIFYRHQTAVRFLTNFGHVVTNLKVIGDEYQTKCINEIGVLIERYSPDSITELTLEKITENPIGKWKGPFHNLTTLKLHNIKQSKHMRIHTIFPNLRKLDIEQSGQPNVEFIGFHFLRLEHLRLAAELLPNDVHLKAFLSLNPQLQSFHTTSYFDVTLLTLINANLPNLRSFGVKNNCFGDMRDNGAVRFDNVTDFTLDVHHLPLMSGSNLQLFKFKQLQTIAVICDRLNVDLLDFVKENKQLTSVAILGTDPNYNQLIGLIQALPKLTKFHTRWANVRDSSSITTLMVNINPIDTIALAVSAANRDELVQRIPDTWRLVGDKRTRLEHVLTFTCQKGESRIW